MKPVSAPFHLCFEILGNPLRISIIRLLKEKPRSVSEIAEQLGEEQSKVSHSLAALKKCRFIESKRQGKQAIYTLTESFLKELSGKDIFEALEAHYKGHGRECWRCCK
jgi:DNA-binding transcriptional ArsR family regulator